VVSLARSFSVWFCLTSVLLAAPAPAPAQSSRAGASAAIRGVVLDPDQRPVAGAEVWLDTPAGTARRTRSGPDGSFVLEALPPGAYVVRASHPGLFAEPVDVRLDAGDDRRVTIALRVSAVTETVVVSAGQVETAITTAPAAVTVFDRGDLAARQIVTLAEALRLVPGLGVAQSGGPGALTSVFPRGGESDYTLVLVDGVRLNSFGGAFDFAALPAAGVERVEVVRGPQSALFGADAIGGVIHVVTARPAGFELDLSAEGGSRRSGRGTARAAGRMGPWWWNAEVERFASDGYTGRAPATGETVSNDDHDRSLGQAIVGFERGAFAARVQGRLFRAERGYPGPFGSDPNGTFGGVDRVSRGWTDHDTLGVSATHTAGARLRTRAQLTVADLEGRFRSPFGESRSSTRRVTVRAQADLALSPAAGLSFGAETLDERATSTFITGAAGRMLPITRLVAGGFAEARLEHRNRLALAAGLRVERIHRDPLEANENPFSPRPAFPADTVVSVNPRLAASWFLRSPGTAGVGRAPGRGGWTRLRASAGTGIRPPDAFEIAFTDNPSLRPERSRSVEAGIEQAFLDGRIVVDAAVFANRYDDLIVAVGRAFADASRFRTDNISNARARGLETSVASRPRAWLSLRAGYTFLDTAILSVDGRPGVAPPPFAPGDPLIRRPRHQGWIDASAAAARWSAFARLGARGGVLDVDPSLGAFGGTLRAPGFAVVDAGGSVGLGGGASLFARATNLLDRAYEEALGFPAPGRAVFVGVRLARGR
jgi:outer membrane cobalamin receptor